jgi:glycosyltransferase involved in cell wall biosynthesis
MRISFVVPAYNEADYLPACLQSIFRETHGSDVETEVIVVNNASTDATRDVAESFAGVRVVDQPIKGLTHARQAGFKACTGELIANVDADSRLPPGWLQHVLDEFAARPQMLALSGPLLYFDLTPTQQVLVQVFYGLAWATYALNRYVLRVGSMVQGGNFIVARRGLEAIGGFNLSISFYGEDTDIARRLNELGEVRFTFALRMLSSARRLNKEGILTTAMRYSLNYFWTTFREHPFTRQHADIREQPEG